MSTCGALAASARLRSCCLLVGDFGPGSDAPIVLDYRFDADQPRVLRLRWSRSEGNRWIVAAPDFAAFVAALG